MMVTPPSDLTCVTTGATALTLGTSASRSAIWTGKGVPLSPITTEVVWGWTMISPPTPTVRRAVSCKMPWVSPTTIMIRTISTATAVIDSSVRTGRAARLAIISRLTNVVCLPRKGLLFQIDQLGSGRLLHPEFLVLERLVERQLGNRQSQ